MKFIHLFVFLSLSHAGWTSAEIYKRIDSEGHVTYSSEPLKGGKKLYLKTLPTTSERSTPEDFPRVDKQTQKKRDNTRRVILEDELATEESLKSKQALLVGADDLSVRKTAHDTRALHEQNIKALQTELSNLK